MEVIFLCLKGPKRGSKVSVSDEVVAGQAGS